MTSQRLVGDVDHVSFTLGGSAEFGRDRLNRKADLLQESFNHDIGAREPNRRAATGVQRFPDLLHPAFFVELMIFNLHHGSCVVVDIEHDHIIGRLRGARYHGPHVFRDDVYALVFEGVAVEARQKSAVPLHNLWKQFDDVHRRLWPSRLKDTLQSKPQTESTNQYLWLKVLRRMPFATNGAEFDLGGSYQGMHELLAVHSDTKAAIVFDERHTRSIGSGGFSKRYIWLHWKAAQTSQSTVASVGPRRIEAEIAKPLSGSSLESRSTILTAS